MAEPAGQITMSNQEMTQLLGLFSENVISARQEYLDALENLSLANVETIYFSLDAHRSFMPTVFRLPFLHPRDLIRSNKSEIHDQFALAATPDYFVRAEDWTEDDLKKPYGNIIQRIEYRGGDIDGPGSGDNNLPRFVFQLGRLMLPGDGPVSPMKLPFVVVVDILDPRRAVWLIHVRDIAEDPEEGQEWYPPQYVLDQLACLFDDKNRRNPAYQFAQVAASLGEWLTLDYPGMINNIYKSRRQGNLRIKMGREVEFKDALEKAKNREALRLLSISATAHSVGPGRKLNSQNIGPPIISQ